ncbi:MAG: ATP-binding cassette domain-containing protein [Deltaproteobacteria bacterium]|nr:ATP-binding cassette domain-containing protein [Deltaproteobacteria bacterium]
MAESLLALRDILVRHGDDTALQISRLEIESGEVLALLGPNGAGKTTLLRVMGLLQLPSTGRIYFKGKQAGPSNALAIRQGIANVFQEPLLLNATVYQNAAIGLNLRGLHRREIEMRLSPWLERLGIAHLTARSARTLSGGEAQRASLARALVLEPELLLLDEPFSALDSTSRQTLLRDFQQIVRETRITTVLVTHDRHEAFALADRIGVLKQGQLLQLGCREEMFLRPETESVAEIVGIENRFRGVVKSLDGGYAEIAINRAKIYSGGEFKIGAKVVVCIRADDVSLNPGHIETKDRNRLKGKIIEASAGMAHHRIVVDCESFHLIALMERQKFSDRILSDGDDVTATFSPERIHVIRDDH